VSKASRERPRWLFWLPAILVMGVIFVLSAQSGLRVSEDADVERPIRATGHLLAYATLAGLLLVALSWGRRPRLRDALIAFGLAFLYALSDEWHQSFVPDRTGRLDDVVTDTIGALIGLALAWVALTWLARRRAQRSEASA
jgi:VanZ family protein